jgi:hypothetical protein
VKQSVIIYVSSEQMIVSCSEFCVSFRFNLSFDIYLYQVKMLLANSPRALLGSMQCLF